MAKRLAIPSKELALRIVGPRDAFMATCVQRVSLNTDVPSTDVDEHGNSQHAGTTVDQPNVTFSFSAFDVSVKIFSVLTGTNADSYPAQGVDISALGEIDAIFYVKDASINDYVKSAHARRMQIRDFTFSYSVNGESTEEYTAAGSEKRWFKNDVIVDRVVTGTTSFTLTQTPVQLKNGNYLMSAILDGVYLEEVSGTPGAGQYRVSGTTVTTGDSRTSQFIAVYHASPAGNQWSDVRDASIPAAIKGRDVKVVIAASNIPRVQSISINGNLNPQPVNEMGNRTTVGYQRQVPTVEGTISVLDTDTELLALLTTGDIASTDTEFSVEGSCVVSGLPLDIVLYDPCDPDVPIKTVSIPSLLITGDGYTSNVNENAQQTFNWRSSTAQCVVYSGARA